ncbi:MAG: NUDIX domain-containing protein [Tannerella sp.]|jgi:isopentenyldiphosphate isomerase|nr:NUDIX domain-containing protein [Tannerella sp.]
MDERNRTTLSSAGEWLPLVNEAGEVTGKATRRACHSGTKPLHPVVHLHVFNPSGALYLQKRPAHKDIQPGKWDTSVGGHVDYGETVETALRREALEELGLVRFTPVFIARYVFESAAEKELVNTFMTICTGRLHPHPTELDGGRFWPLRDIEAHLGRDLFTPNFEHEFHRLRKRMENECRGRLSVMKSP